MTSGDLEKPQPARFDRLGWGVAITLGTFALEAGGLFYLTQGRLPPFLALALHFVVVALLGLWTLHQHRSDRDLRLPFLLMVSTTTLGPLGPLGTMMSVGLAIWFARDPVSVEEWYAGIFPAEELEADLELDRVARTVQGAEAKGNITPFVEIMRFGNVRQKQALIALITKHYRPAFAPVLNQALQDPSNAVRVHAATAISKIEADFLDQSLKLQERARQSGDEAEPILALASHYDDYAFSGVLDADREKENRELARKGYLQYLKLNRGNFEARMAVGRILSRQGNHREGAVWWESCKQEGFSSPEMTLWYMENLFQLKRFSELRTVAAGQHASIESKEDLSLNALETVTLWAGESAFIGSLDSGVE